MDDMKPFGSSGTPGRPRRRSVAMLVATGVLVACSNRADLGSAKGTPASHGVVSSHASASSARMEMGPVLHPDRLPILPRRGLAIEMESGVVLAGLDGHVLGYLPGFKVDELVTIPGPVLLHGPGSSSWILRPGASTLLPEMGVRIPLSDGAELVGAGEGGTEPEVWSIERAARTLVAIRNEAWSVSQDRDLVTLQRYSQRSGVVPLTSKAYDLRTGAFIHLPSQCVAAARRGSLLYLVCDDKVERSGAITEKPTLETMEASGRRHLLAAGPPVKAGEVLAGFWRQAFVSPRGDSILAQWSGECEVQISFLVGATGGEPRPASGVTPWEESPETLALGWTPQGRPLLFLPFAACGVGAERPGVYRVEQDGSLSLVVATSENSSVRLWQ
jgi:hypothetical protein